jgi:hypothetical protein
MRPGAHENVEVGDRYEIYEIHADGRREVIGHAVVEHVGTGLVAAGEGASRADVTENRTQLRITDLKPGHDPANLRASGLEAIR